MSVGLAGIRIESVSIKRGNEGPKVEGYYALMSTADKVLAKQGFNNYGGIEIKMSPDSHKALDAFLAACKADINAVIGLEGGAA